MSARIFFGLLAAIALASVRISTAAADSAIPAAPQNVPGGAVTIEGGVRVIRPLPPTPAALPNEQAGANGSLIYRGAAFYRAPDAQSPNATRPDPGKANPAKPLIKPSTQ